VSAALDAAAAAWLAFARERAEIGLVVLVPLALAAAGSRFVQRGRGAPHLQSALALAALLLLALPAERLVPAAWIPRRVAAALGPLSFGPLPPSLRDARPAPNPGRNDAHGSADSDAAAPLAANCAAPPARTSVATGLFAAWSAIVGALLFRLAWSHRRTRAALRRATPLPASELPLPAAELARRARLVSLPPLVVSDELPAPSTCGVLRPVVVLPPGLRASAGDEGMLFILRHELAHVRRRDPRLALVERLVRIAAFFHPTGWIAGELLARERERACDDAALSALPLAARPACAEALLQVIERSRRHAPAAATALALSRGGRAVKNRLLRILDPSPAAARMTPRARCAAGAAAVVLLVALAARASAPATPPQAAPAVAPAAPRTADATVEAVRAGVDWLVRHQEQDGHWSAAAFDARCKDAACAGAGEAKFDVGVTALATEALLGVGDEKLQPAVTRALDWLVAKQDATTGLIRTPGPPATHVHYEHAYGTLALVDAAGLEPQGRWKKPAEKAIDYLLRARNPYRGWRYGVRDGDNDASLTGLVLVVLGGARTSGIEVPGDALGEALKGGLAYLDEMTDPTTGRTGYQQKGGLTARITDTMERFPAQSSECLTAISLNARLSAANAGAGDALVQKQIALLAAQPAKWDEKGATTDFYYWYFATRGLLLAGGDAWTVWKPAVAAELVDHQSKQGDGAGSFPPADAWSGVGGRVYATALDLLTLEICARSR
jgi:beta-lactamase regulating signal transducer with metallopeptidase domain